MRRAMTVGVTVGWLLATSATDVAAQYFTLVVTGTSGGPEYAETHARWRQALVSALRQQDGFREDHLIVLAETPGPGVGRASRQGVQQALDALGRRMTSESVLLVVLIGHGTDDGVEAKFNLVGPDLDAGAWSAMLDPLPGRVVFVNTTAASAPFVQRVSHPNRVVITATHSAAQRYDTVFPEFFVGALTRVEADADRDGRVSVWEAFALASAEVRRWFQRQGRLATERALLEDTGDGRGTDADQLGPDGYRAARLFVGAGVGPSPASTDPAVVALLREQNRLTDQVARLKSRKPEVPGEEYARQLEALLIELSRVSREIRRRRPGDAL